MIMMAFSVYGGKGFLNAARRIRKTAEIFSDKNNQAALLKNM
jgi:hypothetical protein